MKVALVHYHLLKGGVTTVLRRQVRGLLDSGDEVLVLSGEAEKSHFEGAPLVLLELLRYDERREDRHSPPEALAQALLDAVEGHFGGPADIIHIHNPLILKNSLFLPALALIQASGARVFLQNHDFAEDWRPDVLVRGVDYPANCHYGVINSRDGLFLSAAGLEPGAVHLLPNPVLAPEHLPPSSRTRFVYPVRAIRRKNIGEVLLLSLYLPKDARCAITLPPTSDRDMPYYQFWRESAKRLGLPVEFDLGLELSFEQVLASACAIITSSVKEGFGFSFLEPWIAGRAVIGRRIDYVCRDFESASLSFPDLYDGLQIPISLFDAGALRHKYVKAVQDIWGLYGRTGAAEAVETMESALFDKPTLDFARLDEASQARVLERLCEDEGLKNSLARLNPGLLALSFWKEDEALIEANREMVKEHWSIEAAIGILKEAWRAAIDRPCVQKLDRERLLEHFLDPRNLFLVGTGYD